MSNIHDDILTKEVSEKLLNINELITTEIQKNQSTNITEQTKSRTPAWVYLVGSVIIAGVLIFIYIFIKKIITK
jgi:hypothetical protein